MARPLVAIDTQSATVVSTQPLSSMPIMTQWDQQTGNILAIASCCPNELISINPTSGSVTSIAPVGDATNGFNGASAMDQVNHRYYFMRFDVNNVASLVGINPSTGSVTAQFVLSGPVPFLLGWNAANGNLVGIAGTANPPANPFISIDTATGNESTLSANLQFPDLQGWTSFVSTIDSVRNRFYAICVDLG